MCVCVCMIARERERESERAYRITGTGDRSTERTKTPLNINNYEESICTCNWSNLQTKTINGVHFGNHIKPPINMLKWQIFLHEI